MGPIKTKLGTIDYVGEVYMCAKFTSFETGSQEGVQYRVFYGEYVCRPMYVPLFITV